MQGVVGFWRDSRLGHVGRLARPARFTGSLAPLSARVSPTPFRLRGSQERASEGERVVERSWLSRTTALVQLAHFTEEETEAQ